MTEAEIKKLQAKDKRYKEYLGNGLYVEVLPTSRKIYRLKKGNTTITLGECPDISLKEARLKAYEKTIELKKPKAERMLFETLFNKWVENNDWSPQTRRKREFVITKYISYYFKRNIHEIKRVEILEHLQSIEKQGKLGTVEKVLGILRKFFSYAVICGYIENNPTTELNTVLKKPKNTPRAAILNENDVVGLVKAIDEHNSPVVKTLIQFTMFTLCRPSECRLATWDEIKGNIWTIPAERMKMGKEHIVPLSSQCMEILEKMKELQRGKESKYIFPAKNTLRPLSEATALQALRAMGYDKDTMSMHGFRSMGSTILNEQGFRHDVIEKALAHSGEDKIRAVYNRAEYFEERRKMMQCYADYLNNLI